MAGLSELGRFSEPGLLVMVALADGPKHGYAMQDDIAAMTDERPGPGTLYGAIRRFVDAGLIVERETDEGEDERRRVYALTKAGRRAASEEADRLQRLVSFARSKKLLKG